MHFHWEEVLLKWATLWSIALCSFAVWLTMHFNKQEAVGLLSAHVNDTAPIFILSCDYFLFIFESCLDFSSLFSHELNLLCMEQLF